jgi:hypothetical protein
VIRTIIILTIATFTFLSLPANATDITYCKGVTPKDVKAVIASVDTPKNIEPFLGVWVGNWGDDQLCSSMVITEIKSPNEVQAQYSWEVLPEELMMEN